MINSLLDDISFYSDAKKRLNNLKASKENLEKALDEAPEGRIRMFAKGNRTAFYYRKKSSEKSGTYLKKSDCNMIKKLSQKNYNEKVIKLVEAELDELEKIVNKCEKNAQEIRSLFDSYPVDVKKYIQPLDISDFTFAEQWQAEPYEESKGFVGNKIFDTNRGEKVRSKSELNIANMLDSYGIPYKYECPLKLKNKVIIYPDFTILNARLRKVFYWEHRGMMDDRSYAKSTVARIKDYFKNGYLLGDSLLITEETQESPLRPSEIKAVIERWLL